MRMLCLCPYHRSTEDLEFGEWEDCGQGCRESRMLKLPWTRLGFAPGNDAKAVTD